MPTIEKEALLFIISKKLTAEFMFKPSIIFEELYACACAVCAEYNQVTDILDDCYFDIDEMTNTISILEKQNPNKNNIKPENKEYHPCGKCVCCSTFSKKKNPFKNPQPTFSYEQSCFSYSIT